MLPLYLAPMAELGHRALRELIESFGGCDQYFSEMLSAAAVVSGGPFEKWYLDGGPDPARFVYQICGSDAGIIAKAVEELDKKESAGIDINMGCSAPAIMKTGAGAAWLYTIDGAAEVLRAARKRTGKRLSVKLRIGERDDFEYLLRFCLRLENEGVDLITLHPRTTKEKFKRCARWDYIAGLNAALKIPVVGNGDIDSAEMCQSRAEKGGCRAIMLGRLAVREPWCFAAVKYGSRSKIDREETAARFIGLLSEYQPKEFFQSRARRFFSYYCKNFTWGCYLQNCLARENSSAGMLNVIHNYLLEHPEERFC
ncbi:MAG: tRNA-dihydrouridine synthase family protein [Spirochaetaceae bacterium]|jgi:tRNA-dihydrouridine synthase|nr:tRNA-dihydrouridine synthase family protein [Spirochaetaceae bacterium]